jgi:hypothetical protein
MAKYKPFLLKCGVSWFRTKIISAQIILPIAKSGGTEVSIGSTGKEFSLVFNLSI